MTWWRPTPASSNISEVGYDDENQELLVKWTKSGKTSIYSEVPEALADELSRAPSVGSMLNDRIKPFYSHRYG